MAGIPIPDDWDGVTWACYSIEWPVSQQWVAILNGEMSRPRLARTWDAETGSVVEAQAVGLNIWLKNLETKEVLLTCNDDAIDALYAIADAIVGSSAGAGSGGSCCVGGSRATTVEGIEGSETPPPFFDAPPDAPGTPAYTTRKCKAANLSHQQIKELMQELIDAGVQAFVNLTGFAGLVAATTLVGFALGEILTPFPLIDGLAGATIGFLYSIALAFLDGGIDLDDLLDDLESDDEAFVCALFSSDSGDVAISNYLAVADDVGMTASNQALLAVILVVDWLNALYFSPEGSGAAFEAALDGYTAPESCDDCECPPGSPCDVTFTFDAGAEGWTFTDCSTGASSATGAWGSGVLNTTLNGLPLVETCGRWELDVSGLQVCTSEGDTFGYTLQKTSPVSVLFNMNIQIEYIDDSIDAATGLSFNDTDPHTHSVTATKRAQVKLFRMQVTAEPTGSFTADFTSDDATIDLATSEDCPS